MGRPRLPARHARTRQVRVLLTEDELVQLTEWADGRPLAVVLREAALALRDQALRVVAQHRGLP